MTRVEQMKELSMRLRVVNTLISVEDLDGCLPEDLKLMRVKLMNNVITTADSLKGSDTPFFIPSR
ncbi:MAG: hypothetical protein C4617_04505 [Candidatus Liberibacter europaeus]|uniref:Uncharacterized protein n=1 Tax=Candidatus Liberibacter europaeus TaxID=744859 RepID=A0A2T4VWX1_9HYPH|nr:hypothetical protein [Candidatus Liberibacter europaeus]MBY7649783.1 hypothetical protein [Candidatus Liberibacter europaeus]PTL86186.1 MAG: hypothetical protein C4617_04770 [Candidatus Liberibacter europaeus]PTL86271.1 MAG: hypothetical protein C4617_04505 [Candidatus Liberibacter europaeus]